jgi:hypothetical protein
MMEAVRASETSVDNHFTRQYIPEDNSEHHCDLSLSLMMEAVRASETSVDNHFTRQYNPEDNSEHHTGRRENLKSHTHLYAVTFTLAYQNRTSGNQIFSRPSVFTAEDSWLSSAEFLTSCQ